MNDDMLLSQSGDVNRRRQYNSPMRDERARETRSRILNAAKTLFLKQGYISTTIAGIARESGVATQTVYATFGTKRAILTAVMGEAIGGDDRQVSVLERADPQRMREEPDQRTQLRMIARGIREILDRAGPMFDAMRIAAASDAKIATAYTSLQEERRRNMTSVVEWIIRNGPLKLGLAEPEAADILWLLTSPDVHRMLRQDRGWPSDRYEEWLAESLVDALLA